MLDIECWGWSNYLVGVTVTKGFDIKIHATAESMVDYLLSVGGNWWGHNSGKYDSLQILEILRQRGIGQSISMAQSRVTRTMGGGLTIRDSYGLIPMGLEDVAVMGRQQIPRLWFDCHCSLDCGGYCAIRRKMPYYMRKRLEEYCVQDCLGLLHGLNALQELADENDFDLQGTIGGSSWATARRVLCLPDADFASSQWGRIRSAYYGGRCAVFRPHVNQPGSHWDIGSAYPAALANSWLPVGEVSEYGARMAGNSLLNERPGVYSCTISVPDVHVPSIPWAWGERLSFPIGTVSGVWTLPEIRHAIDTGCSILSVHWGVVWAGEERVFSSWVKGIYELRRSHGKDSPFGKWLRLFPNSLCGKMAERPDKRYLRLNPPMSDIIACPGKAPCTLTSCSGVCGAWEQVDRWGQMWSVPFYKPSESGHIHWAAYITAQARIMHHRAIESHGMDAVYAHTDSLWTTGQTPPVPTGTGLGEWDRKGGFTEWEGPAPGAYAYTDEETGERIISTAGATLRSADWTKGEAVQDRGVLGILDAARSGRGLFTRAHRRWTVPRHGEWYGDRRATGTGHTRAVDCDALRTRLYERQRERAVKRAKDSAT